jgi:hypothetical protein
MTVLGTSPSPAETALPSSVATCVQDSLLADEPVDAVGHAVDLLVRSKADALPVEVGVREVRVVGDRQLDGAGAVRNDEAEQEARATSRPPKGVGTLTGELC